MSVFLYWRNHRASYQRRLSDFGRPTGCRTVKPSNEAFISTGRGCLIAPFLKARRPTGNASTDLRDATCLPRSPASATPDATMPRDDPPRRASESQGGSSNAPRDSGVSSGSVVSSSCTRCHTPPSEGSKLHVCAGCQTAAYCGVECQRAHWPSHKLDCKALGKMHERSVESRATQKAKGRPSKNQRFFFEWYSACPVGPSKRPTFSLTSSYSRCHPSGVRYETAHVERKEGTTG